MCKTEKQKTYLFRVHAVSLFDQGIFFTWKTTDRTPKVGTRQNISESEQQQKTKQNLSAERKEMLPLMTDCPE